MKWLFFLLLLVSLPLLLAAAPGETVSAQLPVLDNVARDRPAFCSSVEDTCTLCRYAVDGDLATRWSSQFSDPQWIYRGPRRADAHRAGDPALGDRVRAGLSDPDL